MGATACVLLLVVYLAPLARSEPVASGTAVGAGWRVSVPGISDPSLVPSETASVPVPCPGTGPCENHATDSLVDAEILGDPWVDASAVTSEAHAFKDPVGSGSPERLADLQAEMVAQTSLTLPTDWNLRGYGSVANFTALSGMITADLVEAEAVAGTRVDGSGNIVGVLATGASIQRLRIVDPVTGLEVLLPNQRNASITVGTTTITYWETNWDPATGGTTDGQPQGFVNTLHIVDTTLGVDIIVGRSQATAVTYEAPPPNSPPDAVDDSRTTEQDTPITINVTANDTDSDGTINNASVTYTQPSSGTVTCTDNLCTYTPNTGFTGTDTFTYTVCDDEGACDTATVTVTVEAADGTGGTGAGGNAAPNAWNDNTTTGENDPVTIDVTANDRDSDGTIDDTSVTYRQPSNGSVSCTDNICTYTPDPGFVGTDTFDYTVCDNDGACDTATVTIIVTANIPPDAVDDARTTDYETGVTLNVTGNDTDSDGTIVNSSVTYTQPANGSVTCTNNNCTYTPAAGFSGIDTFTYTVCDNDGACDTATVTITVAAADGTSGTGGTNADPNARDDSATTQQGSSVVIDVTANDTDSDGTIDDSSVTYTQPVNGSVTCTLNLCTYTPNPGFSGTDTFDYTVCDNDGACDTAIVTITVNPVTTGGGGGTGGGGVTQPPTANDDTVTVQPGESVTIVVTGNDSDNADPSTVTVVDPPDNGTVECTNGACTYTPDDGFTGEDDFTYEVCNGAGQCDQATVVIVVPPAIPDTNPPVAADDEATTRRGTPVPITVTQNDSDPDGDLDTSSVRIVQPPANGSVTCVGGLCTYSPNPGFTGEDSFVYEVCDATGNCDTATVTVVVEAPDNDGSGGPGGSIGEGGSSGGGKNNGGGGGSGRPNRDGQPSSPNDDAPAAPAAPPLTALNPILGAPKNPTLPMTGGEPGFYLALAFNLVLAGGLLLFLDARSRREQVWNVPALLSGGTDLLERSEAPVDIVLPATEPEPEAAVEPEAEVAPVIEQPAPKKQTGPKPAATKKPVAKKATPKEPAAKKPSAKQAATTKKPAAKKAASTKASTAKSTVAKKKSSTKKSTVAKKATSTKKSTVVKKKS